MPGCAVATCRSNTHWKNDGIIFHKFLIEKTIIQEWAVKCKRADHFNLEKAFVCSKHFLPDDYERDLQNELLNLPLRK